MKMVFSNIKKTMPQPLLPSQPPQRPIKTPVNKTLFINIPTNCSTCDK